ncbi:MAG: putative quinol monooxygenase [Hydrogenophaga sp.]|uniref:putative quinol monooxygenase n=1 Tax=Pseudomonadota TaxID=1224 RepID=UPI002719728A|nr:MULTISPECIES: putative quinol monooxygenase [Pseudomonadota]MDO9128080.1 putative quinol monooxygenase [Parvibaculum sp.]MDP1627626.1 putative quinol monooxygenase [Parvibaculum sp.]MDP2243728.1 putative quinol monooxygenase [Pseudomonas sp.]MDP3328671.1 putative quinol monooxygenase [Parvibaculum sp.]MDZ4187283.1 putative quinol monooxygenase [Hydrogenophaga sp.]
MSVIGVVATLKVQPGKEAEFEKVFGELRSKVKANEKGCLQYDFFKSKSEPSTFVVMEQYASQADLDAHGKTEYFRAAGPALGAVLGGAPTLLFLDKVE